MKDKKIKKTDEFLLRNSVSLYEQPMTAEEYAAARERASHEFRTPTGEYIRYTAPKLWEVSYGNS
ncbi:MAG TPA: hypothetical protein O0X97_00125 [Methanocorpusculum sp.]|nr:hypothetical protein [Methanocorpusculum sp.]